MWDNRVRTMTATNGSGKRKKCKPLPLFTAVCFFGAFLLLDKVALPPAKFPFFPENVCMAFLDASLEAQPGCGPCAGELCPSPCPNGVCLEGSVVGPCPAGAAQPPEGGYGNTSTPGGPVCPEQVISPGDAANEPRADGLPRMCPTGIPPGTDPLPPGPFVKLSAEAYCLEVCPANTCGRGLPSETQQAAFSFFEIMDDIIMGFGCMFIIFRGLEIVSLPASKLRRNALVIYVCLAMHTVMWYPHMRLHGQMTTPAGITTLDIVFHTPHGLSALVLVYFVDRATIASSKYKWEKHKGLKRYFLNRNTFALWITFIVGNIAFASGYSAGASCAQVFAGFLPEPLAIISLITYYIEAMMFGGAIAYLIVSYPVVNNLTYPEHKSASWMLTLAFFFQMGNWFIHISLHNSMPTPWDPHRFIVLDFAFHLPIVACSIIVFFKVNMLLDMAMLVGQNDKSMQRSGQSAAVSSKASVSRQSSSSRHPLVNPPASK